MKNEGIIDRIDWNVFEHDEEDYNKLVRVGKNFGVTAEYESNGDRNKTLSIEECLDKIRSNFKYIINNISKFDTWKTQLR